MKTVAEQIADWLAGQGLEQVFAVTGGGAMFLNQALGGHPQLRCAYMHHEQACAMAAEGYARVSGKPAIVNTTTGPGSINALNGVFGAYTDSVPMLVISGQVKSETCLDFHDLPGLRQLGDQEGPTIALAEKVCKLARLVRNPRDLEQLLPLALDTAVGGRPGPVWLDIPLDIQSARVPLQFAPRVGAEPVADPATLEAQCAELLRRLRQAHRPLVLAGTGVRIAGVVDRLRALIERAGIPMGTAWTHDLLASGHPLFAGRPGTIGTRGGNFCLQAADVVLVLGSRLNIRQTSYNFEGFAKNAWVAQVDIDAAELAKPTVRPDLGIHAGLHEFLDAFERLLVAESLPDFSPWARWCRQVNADYAVRREHAQAPGQVLNPYLVVARVFDRLRSDDIVVCGNASACIMPFQVGDLKAGQRLLSNSGSASMGHDLPAAIGAAAAGAREGRRVICFAGDGSLQMNIQELQTLKTLGVPVTVVVLNNRGYLSIWQTHENFFGRVLGATPESGVEFPDFRAVAQAYGLAACTIDGEKDLPQLDAWIDADGPQVIEVMVDPRQGFAPRIKSRVDEQGRFSSPELDDMFPFLPQETLDAVRASAARIRALPRPPADGARAAAANAASTALA